ncbi:uncharacterized protein LOC111465618 isoform X1 [Cucurbita maxima]|uniref:Uncharacterized protein LOC111465618 isoform X1 n=1 Tax=Cucurbita maxima TaxID=3661 RepID=A0A6J1HQ69_CUCMA|nr:uncharacterized protein LOC111465618 isoform X1 [Cucurbita maxima]XP_022965857.1 uncharacterized protein LOC111465618 isoform X1 [Cucurbita maxima]XP_022965858.1 uncharacterized protein LOC111465618 isoform X1 [Cucurbita maxima]
MAQRTKNMNIWYLFMMLNFNLLLPFSSGESNDVCVSKGGRFAPFAMEGKPPKKVSKAQDLTLCRVFRKKTCCGVAQTYPALLSFRRLASTGEGNQECLQLWELLECSICDPLVGIQPGPPLICPSFCDRVFNTCSDAYFSVDAKTQVLAPCGVNDFVCGRASEWVSNGTQLCSAAGFSVKIPNDETSCYGSKARLDSIANSWKSSPSVVVSQRTGHLGVLEDFQQWVKEMSFREQVSWLISSMVLSAGLLLASKRKSHIQRQKYDAIRRATKKMEASMSPNSLGTQGIRKRSRR